MTLVTLGCFSIACVPRPCWVILWSRYLCFKTKQDIIISQSARVLLYKLQCRLHHSEASTCPNWYLEHIITGMHRRLIYCIFMSSIYFSSTGEIVIVYDAKSNGDQNGRLYDKELTSIQRIDELKMLDSKKCVLSINRKFSDFQKNHLQGKISSTFGWKNPIFISFTLHHL